MTRERLLTAMLLLALLGEGGWVAWYRSVATPGAGEAETVVFELTGVASSGVWTLQEVNGLNYWWKDFEAAVLHVPEGAQVVINLRSADLFHEFYIPELGLGPVDIEPGHMATLRFRADHAGVFQYYCTSMCGGCHFYMRGWLVVTREGETPIQPQPILCGRCRDDLPQPPRGGDLVDRGAYLYLEKGCTTCHGPDGRGGVRNENANNSPVPAHDTTAQKLFISSREDAELLLDLLEAGSDLSALEEEPDIRAFPVVRTRFENAREIVRHGRYSGKSDPAGPEPPLQMPAWQYLVEEREIDALLAYFVSIYPWEEDENHLG